MKGLSTSCRIGGGQIHGVREFSIAEVKRHFAYAGEPTNPGYDLDEIRWRMYQWRKVGLVYFSERLDRLAEEGRVAACFAVGPPGNSSQTGRFVPEPFPILADVYDALRAAHQWDRVALLTEMANFKLVHETRHTRRRFADPDEYGLYCTFIDRFYDTDRPYKGTRLYWILFDERGVEFFSETFKLDPVHLEKFMVRAPRRTMGRNAPRGWDN